jgi:hypothetical protein
MLKNCLELASMAVDSYEIFFKKNYSVKPTDKELKRYLEQEVYNVS